MKKNIILVSLLTFVSFLGISHKQFISLNSQDYEDYSNVFYNVGGSPYDNSNKGVIVGQSQGQSFYYMNLIIGSVDEELDSMLKPNIFVGFSFENQYMYFRRNIIDNNNYEFSNKDFFNILELNISFSFDYTSDDLVINLSGYRIKNSLVVPYDFDLRFYWYSPYDLSEQLPSIYFNYFDSVNFKFYNNVLISSFNDGYDLGKEEGFEDGKKEGFDDGYEKGVKDTELSTSLIGNVIFTTIGSIASFVLTISSFEVLGVSIGSLVAFVISVGLLVIVLGFIRK